ncbi:MAG: efflux RND transporter periplasmic adaptor subunit [Gemmatimonadetes bacterium]|nr:efflux RND transporter periplasmic adaptor subunit [Gemmatimonadota bacterium]
MSTRTFCILLLTPVIACARADDAAVGAPEYESIVVTQWNDSTELFLEYPHPVAGRQTGNWAIHLSSMKDFKPIRSGMVTVRFMSGDAEAESFTIDSPARDGIFLLDPVIASAGAYRVELALESPQVRSRHVLPEVRVFADLSEVPLAAVEEDAGIAFLKEQQWQIPFEVLPAEETEVQRTVMAPGEIVAPDGGLVEIGAPVDGIAAAAGNRSAPSVGQRVRQGDVLVVLAPTAQDGGIAAARGRLERLEREVARTERLFAAGAIPERRLEEAKHDYEIVRAEVEAMGLTGGDGYTLRITSPIAGIVARRSFVPGRRISAGEPLFTIVELGTAWLRVQVPAAVAPAITPSGRATFTIEGAERVHKTSRLVSIGRVVDPATRTVPVTFEIADAANLAFGQFARVAVPVEGVERGVTIPNHAIVDDNGTPVAYVQVGGETFERRVLNLGTTDGVHTLVLAGVNRGEMVVAMGAYHVRLASMSGGEFAGGHAH